MSSSSHSTKSIGSELKSLKTLLKEVSQTVQSIAYRQLESETKLNDGIFMKFFLNQCRVWGGSNE